MDFIYLPVRVCLPVSLSVCVLLAFLCACSCVVALLFSCLCVCLSFLFAYFFCLSVLPVCIHVGLPFYELACVLVIHILSSKKSTSL